MRSRSLRAALTAALLVTGLTTGPALTGPATADQGPALTLDRGTADAGSRLVAHGSGFTGSCDVLLLWGSTAGAVVGHADIGAAGAFTTRVRVPRHAADGPSALVARSRGFGPDGCARDDGRTATASVEVTAGSADVNHDVALLTRRVRSAGVDAATIRRAQAAEQPVHAVVSLHRLPAAGDLADLRAAGVRPLAYLNARGASGTAYLASISPSVTTDGRFADLVRGVVPLTAADKIDLVLAQQVAAAASGSRLPATVLFFPDVSPVDAQAALSAADVSATRDGRSDTWRARLDEAAALRLAGTDAVQFVAAVPERGQLELDTSRREVERRLGAEVRRRQRDLPRPVRARRADLHQRQRDRPAPQRLRWPVDSAPPSTRSTPPTLPTTTARTWPSIAAGSGLMSNQTTTTPSPSPPAATPTAARRSSWRGMAPQAEIQALNGG